MSHRTGTSTACGLRGSARRNGQATSDLLKPGQLRLLYKANPISFIVEQAGGGASTGRERVLDVGPDELHQRVALIFGSREEVERIEQYHRDRKLHEYNSPLFSVRGLFRAPA